MTKMLAPIYDLSSVRTKVKVALDFGKENSMYLEMNDIMRKAKYFVLTSQSGSTEYPVTGYEVRRHDSYRKGIIFCPDQGRGHQAARDHGHRRCCWLHARSRLTNGSWSHDSSCRARPSAVPALGWVRVTPTG